MLLLTFLGLLASDLRFDWVRGEGAEACPDRARLVARAEDELGLRGLGREGTATASVSVEGLARCDDAGCVAVLTVYGPSGEVQGRRKLSAPDCAGLEEAVLLSLSLVPGADAREPVRPRTDEEGLLAVVGPADPPPEEAPPPSPPEATNPPDPSSVLGSAELRALFHRGLLPDGLGQGLELGVRSRAWWGLRLGLGLRYLPLRRASAVGVSLTAAWTELCWGGALGGGPLELEACTRGHLGATTVSVSSDEQIQSTGPGDYPWAALSGGLRVGLTVYGPFAVVAEAELMAPLMRRSLLVDGRPELGFREDAVVPVGALGVAARF